MRITGIHVRDIMPIRRFEVEGLSDVVVFAGANGVGKTRLLEALIQFLRNIPVGPDRWITVEATTKVEREQWGKSMLDTRVQRDADALRQTLQQRRKRAGQRSSVLNFESDRSIAQIKPYAFTWEAYDPFDEEVGWEVGLSYLRNRFQDTLHSIFRKVRSRREAIAIAVEKLFADADQASKSGANKVEAVQLRPDSYPDPMIPFRDAFSQLLAPKALLDPDLRNQTLRFTDGATEHPITALSSGEREVVNIVFDFILRNPSDCVVIFDEPELHLHPELSFKLIQTLRRVGLRNQFIFCTHSADIISSSLENSVVFVTPPKVGDGNQALLVREDDDTHQALKLIGQSIGIVALGRRIVLIEGERGSLDKQAYGAILKSKFPNLILVPSGGKSTVQSFSNVREKVLSRALWGVDFFMLCDRDAVPPGASDLDIEQAAGHRLKVLPRYHLENYFLDEVTIAEVFSSMVAESSWLRDPQAVRQRLDEIAREYVSYATALIVSSMYRDQAGNLDIMPKGVHGKTWSEVADLMCDKCTAELARIEGTVSLANVRQAVQETSSKLEQSILDGSWRSLIPGRPILGRFCGTANAAMDVGRFKMAYLKAAERSSTSPFADIESIFGHFSNYQVV